MTIFIMFSGFYYAAHETENNNSLATISGKYYLLEGKFSSEITNDGSVLFKPRKDLPEYTIKIPVDWNADPFNDINWVYNMHAWRVIEPWLLEYQRSGNLELLDHSKNIILDWHDFHAKNSAVTEVTWDEMATGIRALKLAYITKQNNKEQIFSHPESSSINLIVTKHLEFLTTTPIMMNNHGLFQIFGYYRLCEQFPEHDQCKNFHSVTNDNLAMLFNDQFTDDYIHKEHSPAYHYFVLESLDKLIGSDAAFGLDKALDAAKKHLWFFIKKDDTLVEIGDTAANHKVDLPLEPSAKFPKTCSINQSCYYYSNTASSGYEIIKSFDSDSLIFLTGMHYSYTHKHADDLSFVLQEFGREIFVDSGQYAYVRKDFMRHYVTSLRAHNTVSFADKRIGPLDNEPYGSALSNIEIYDDYFQLGGSVNRKGLFKHKRILIYRPSHSLKILDQIDAKETSLFASNLHLALGLTPNIFEKKFTVQINNEIIMEATLLNNNCELKSSYGVTEPKYLGWVTTSYKIMAPIYTIQAICSMASGEIGWDITFNRQEIIN